MFMCRKWAPEKGELYRWNRSLWGKDGPRSPDNNMRVSCWVEEARLETKKRRQNETKRVCEVQNRGPICAVRNQERGYPGWVGRPLATGRGQEGSFWGGAMVCVLIWGLMTRVCSVWEDSVSSAFLTWTPFHVFCISKISNSHWQ